MKTSLNWLKDYIDIKDSPSELSEILTNLGLEVEGEDTIESVKGGLRGLIVGHVTECIKHPNADKLSLTKVNVGGAEDLQIVCGAPNVAAGQKVVVAQVGTELFPTDGEHFTIKKGKIRGETSEGMICAEDEIGIGTDHDGIIVLPEDTAVGRPVAEIYEVSEDMVYDIGLTPNRSDATSHIGVAEDLCAYYNFHGEGKAQVRVPETLTIDKISGSDDIKVTVADSAACPRYSGICLSDIKIGPAPQWMQDRLKAIDVRPINNVVDITNYVLHEYGQPLHAFDRRQITGDQIKVQFLKKGTVFQCLDEVDRKLSDKDLMICDGQDNGMCIGGVFGGLKSGVKDDTTNIFLESAHFESQGIRKTSTHHNLRTDAAKCFEKGSDPNVTVKALMRAVYLLQEHAGGKVTSNLVDIYPDKIEPKEITVRRSAVGRLIGNDFSHEQLMVIYKSLNFDPSTTDGEHYDLKIPTNKADVTREVDVIEEVLRIYGYNSVTVSNTIKAALQVADPVTIQGLRDKLSERLIGKGYHEIMGLSLVTAHQADILTRTPGLDHVAVNNTSNVDLNIMRPDMLLSMLNTVSYNFNRQQNDLKLFEFGKTYHKTEDYKETEYLSMIQTGVIHTKAWQGEDEHSDIYSLKQLVNEVLSSCGMTKYQVRKIDDDRFATGLQYHQGDNVIASFGVVSEGMKESAEVKNDILYAEISVKSLLRKLKKTKIKVGDISKFPESKRDIALVVDDKVTYQEIEAIIKKTGKNSITDVNLFDVYRDDNMTAEGKKSYAVSMTFVSHAKSLSDKEINKIMNKIIESAKRQLGAELR
jgi:phenylalanyl-tRNA synthetase beta chain